MNAEYGKSEIEIMLKSQDGDVVIDALLYACFNINDPKWILGKCINLIDAGLGDDVRGVAVTCIGHVARIYRNIDREEVVPFLNEKLRDEFLAGRAQDALDDIEKFTG